MSIISGSAAISTTGSSDFYNFPIGQSLMFDGSNYLQRTPSGGDGNRKKFTLSMWIKITKMTAYQGIFVADNTSNSTGSYTRFNYYTATNGKVYFEYRDGSSGGSSVVSTPYFRDFSAWYHFVFYVDLDASDNNDKYKFYVNSVSMPDSRGTLSVENTGVNASGAVHRIGQYEGTNDFPLHAYLANIELIDGQALFPHYFAELKNGVWIPKSFNGTSSDTTNYNVSGATYDYGKHGFLIDFSSVDTSSNIINDTAPTNQTNHNSANNWTAIGF